MKSQISTIILFAFLFLQTESLEAQNPDGCPFSIMGFTTIGQVDDYRYFLSQDKYDWDAAAELSLSHGGNLATILDAETNNFLRERVGNQSTYIGFNDSAEEGVFAWHSGEEVTINNYFGVNSPSGDHASINYWNGNWTFHRQPTYLPFVMEMYCPLDLTNAPDLILTNLSGISTALEPGASTPFYIEISNVGGVDAANVFNVEYYLSDDPIYSTDDTQIGNITAGFIGTTANATINCLDQECLIIPADQPSGNYYFIAIVDTGNTIFEANENNNTIVSNSIISIGPSSFIDPCEQALGSFTSNPCINFNPDGSFTITGKTSNDEMIQNQYSETGVLLSTISVTGVTTASLENNEIVERDAFDNIISTTPLDADIVTTYSTGDNEIGEFSKNQNGGYYLIGRVVGTTPAPWVPWEPVTPESTSDEFILHHLDLNGNEITSFLVANLSYTAKDIFFLGLDLFAYSGMICKANGDIEFYLKKTLAIAGGNYPTSTYQFEADYSSQTAIQVDSEGTNYSGGYSTSLSSSGCQESTYNINNALSSWSPHGSSSNNTISTWNHSVYPPILERRLFTAYSNTYGQGNRVHSLMQPLENGNELQISRSESIAFSFLPGAFTIQEMDPDSNIIYTNQIDLSAVPIAIHQMPDGTYHIITIGGGSLTLCNSDCTPLIGENPINFQGQTAEVKSNFEITTIYPNPVSSSLMVRIESKVEQGAVMTIFNGNGKEVMQESISIQEGTNSFEYSVHQLYPGIYYVSLDGIKSKRSMQFVKI